MRPAPHLHRTRVTSQFCEFRTSARQRTTNTELALRVSPIMPTLPDSVQIAGHEYAGELARLTLNRLYLRRLRWHNAGPLKICYCGGYTSLLNCAIFVRRCEASGTTVSYSPARHPPCVDGSPVWPPDAASIPHCCTPPSLPRW